MKLVLFVATIWCCLVSILCAVETHVKMKSRPRDFYRTSNTPDLSVQSINGEKSVDKTLQDRIIYLALYMDKTLSKCSTKDTNVLFAPLNIVKTLSIVMLGAAGRTEKELHKALGDGLLGKSINNDLRQFHDAMGKLLRLINTVPNGVDLGTSLDIASGVFIQQDYPVQKSYIEDAKRIYRTEVNTLNFTGDGYNSANSINLWISQKTHGRIREIVAPPINALTKVIIAGALYFKGDWKFPFLEKITKWQPFFLGAEGKYGKEGSVLVEMMVNQGSIPYYENKQLGYQAIGLPYKGEEVVMYIILPKLKTSLKQLMCKLKPEEINTMIDKATLAEVFYVIPKMKLDHEVNLRETLEQLGVRTMFDPQTANFSNLAEGVHVSDILHKVNVDVNERGTVAAATTTVSVNRGGYVNFRAERPFFFFIYNTKVRIITFWGSIKKPVPFRPNPNPE